MIVCITSVATKVAVTSEAGDFGAGWVGPPDPEPGLCLDVEVDLGADSLVWGVDLRPAESEEEPGIVEREGAYILTGVARGPVQAEGLWVSVTPHCLVLLRVRGDLPSDLDGLRVVVRSPTCVLYPTHV